ADAAPAARRGSSVLLPATPQAAGRLSVPAPRLFAPFPSLWFNPHRVGPRTHRSNRHAVLVPSPPPISGFALKPEPAGREDDKGSRRNHSPLPRAGGRRRSLALNDTRGYLLAGREVDCRRLPGGQRRGQAAQIRDQGAAARTGGEVRLAARGLTRGQVAFRIAGQ